MSVEFSFEELRARHRGWLDRDWGAVRREEQKRARKLAEKAAAASQPKSEPVPLAPKTKPLAPKTEPLAPKTEPLAPKQDAQKPPKLQIVPLKGGEEDAMAGSPRLPLSPGKGINGRMPSNGWEGGFQRNSSVTDPVASQGNAEYSQQDL